MTFEAAWEKTVGHERGYVNHPSDRGGPTNHGVTERVARANGYQGDMRDLPIELAKQIGKAQYWDVLNLDAVDAVSPVIAAEMFDTLYNGGEPGAWLQRALNVYNRQQRDYADITVDGRIGPITIAALRGFLARRGALGERVLFNTLNALQLARFVAIAEARESQEDFAFGWAANRAQFMT